MMGKTHFTMGMATSLAVSFFAMRPENLSDNLVALAGGALGGVLADADTVDNDYKHDALIGQLLGFAVFAVVAALDYFVDLGVWAHIAENKTTAVAGAVIFFILYVIGICTEHRTFTHSLLALALFSGCFSLIYERLGFAVLMGYASHLLLDILNKKEVPLLWPKGGGICLRLCYASKAANMFFMIVGFIASLGLLGYRLYPYIVH